MRLLRPALILALSLLAACSGEEERPYVERPAEDLYLEASLELERGNNELAAELFDEVERQHPYSLWSPRAQLMSAYAYYEVLDYDEAVSVLDRFIELHPAHDNVDYAYYLRAICYYEQIVDVGRDQALTREALDALNQVIERFPSSAYARDAVLKRDLALDHLAGKEMSIGRFYLGRQQYSAAVGRFQRVLTEYQTTSHVPEALHRLVEIHIALGLPDQAQQYAAILGHNYPGNEWYQDSYELLNAEGYYVPRGPETTWQSIQEAVTSVF